MRKLGVNLAVSNDKVFQMPVNYVSYKNSHWREGRGNSMAGVGIKILVGDTTRSSRSGKRKRRQTKTRRRMKKRRRKAMV